VQATSLHLANAFLTAEQTTPKHDYQVVIPLLLVAFVHPSRMVRAAAATCSTSLLALFQAAPGVKDLAKKKDASSGFELLEYEAFYGLKVPSGTYLSLSEVLTLLTLATKFESEMSLDSEHFEKQLSEFFSLKKGRVANREILTFLTTAIVASEGRPAVQARLLSVLRHVDVPPKTSALKGVITTLLKLDSAAYFETPVYSEILDLVLQGFTPATAGHFEPEGDLLPLFLQALSNGVVFEGETTVQLLSLRRITKEFFAAVPAAGQKPLFSKLCDIAVSTTTAVAKAVKAVVVSISLHSSLLIHELVTAQRRLKEVPPSPAKKRKTKASESAGSLPKLSQEAIHHVVVLLEMIEMKDHIVDPADLVPVLFDLLAEVLNSNSEASLEYVKQLLLSALLVITRFVLDSGIQLEERNLRVDLIIQCIRTSENPQTHNYALLLMATIATVYPDPVLSNVMPVFTFMGANVLRQDDNYSFLVIQQTLETVIPPLVAFQKKNNADSFTVTDVKPVMKVFVDALLHIPKHRRLRLFTVLVSTLGGDDFLHPIVALILEKNILLNPNVNPEKDKLDPESLSSFCITLANQFSSETVLKSLVQLLTGLNRLPQEKPAKLPPTAEREHLFNLRENNGKQLRQFKMAGLVFLSELLSNKVFLQKLLTTTAEQEDLEKSYLALLEQALVFISAATSEQTKFQDDQNNVLKLLKFLTKTAYDILDKVNGLLRVPSFVNVITNLMKHENPSVRKRALMMLNEKATSLQKEEITAYGDLFVGTLGPLNSIIAEDSSPVNKQTALLSIEMLAKAFAHIHAEVFLTVIPPVVAIVKATPNLQVCASAVICLGSLSSELETRVLPMIPKLVPAVTGAFDRSMAEGVTESDKKSAVLLQLSVISALHEIVNKLPQFVSPYLADILRCSLHPSMNTLPPNPSQQDQQLQKKNKIFLKLLARNVAPRLVLPAVFDFFSKASPDKHTYAALFGLLGSTFSSMNREAVIAFHADVFKFYIEKAFGVRRLVERADVEEVEAQVTGSFLQLTVKLNEKLFKPMLLQALEWATGEDVRRVFFYKFVASLADQLKSIFVPFFSYLLDDAVTQLTRLLTQFGGKGQAAPLKLDAADSLKLWQVTVDSFSKCLLFDSDGLFDREKFERIMQPLVDQLDSSLQKTEAYEANVAEHLVPCLAQLAVTVGNDALWKPLNYQTLLKTRAESPKVRVAALKVQLEFYRRLGNEFVVLLPETIPFLSELLEDDDEQVEKQCKEVVALIEQHLGEPIRKYLKA